MSDKQDIKVREPKKLPPITNDLLQQAQSELPAPTLLGQQEITLTIQQIKELAEFAGLTISTKVSSLDDMEAEITVLESEKGVEVIEDDGSRVMHKHVAYFTDYPEEGAMPIGRPNVPDERPERITSDAHNNPKI